MFSGNKKNYFHFKKKKNLSVTSSPLISKQQKCEFTSLIRSTEMIASALKVSIRFLSPTRAVSTKPNANADQSISVIGIVCQEARSDNRISTEATGRLFPIGCIATYKLWHLLRPYFDLSTERTAEKCRRMTAQSQNKIQINETRPLFFRVQCENYI